MEYLKPISLASSSIFIPTTSTFKGRKQTSLWSC